MVGKGLRFFLASQKRRRSQTRKDFFFFFQRPKIEIGTRKKVGLSKLLKTVKPCKFFPWPFFPFYDRLSAVFCWQRQHFIRPQIDSAITYKGWKSFICSRTAGLRELFSVIFLFQYQKMAVNYCVTQKVLDI